MAKDARAAADLANAGRAYDREQAALARARTQRDYAAHEQALRMNASYDKLTQARLSAQRAAVQREGSMRSEANAMNAAFDARRQAQIQAAGSQQAQAQAMNARRDAALRAGTYQRDYVDHEAALKMNDQVTRRRAADAAAGAANTFGGKFKATLGNWGRSASDSLISSFKSNLNSGLVAAMASAGAAIAARKIFKDNVDATAVKFGLQSAYGDDADGGKARGADMEKRMFDLAQKFGIQFAGAARASIGFVSAANVSGMSDKNQMKVLNGLFATKTAMGLGEGDMQNAARAVGQMVGKQFVMSEELKLQLNDSIPGLYGAAISYITKNSGGVVKNGGDVDKLLAGQLKNKDGKTVRLESAKFLPGFFEWLGTKNGKAALEAADTGPSAGINRLTNNLFKLNEELGKSGAIAGFNRAMGGMAEVLLDPQLVGVAKQLGKNFKSFIDDLAPMGKAVGDWVRGNSEMVVGLVGTAAKWGGASVAMTAFLAVLGFLFSPVVKIIGLIGLLTGGFFGMGGQAGWALKALKTFAAFLIGPAVAAYNAYTAAQLAANLAGTGSIGMWATMKLGVMGLIGTIVRLVGVLGAAAGAYAAFQTVAGMVTQHAAQGALEETTVGKTPAQLRAQVAKLEAGKEHAGDSWIMTANSKLNRGENWLKEKITGKRGTANEDINGTASALYQGKIDAVSGILANGEKATAAAEVKKATDALKVITDKLGTPETTESLLTVGDGKGKKGRGANASAGEIKSSEMDQKNRLEAADLELAKERRAAREELLDQELADGLVSYKNFYEAKQKLATEKLDEEAKIALTAKNAEIAAIKKALAAGKPDAASRAAAGTRIETAELEYAKKLLSIDERRTREKSKLEQAGAKEEKTYARRLADLRAELDKLNGRPSLDAQDGAVDAEFSAEVTTATANKDEDRLAMLKQVIAARKELGRLAQLDEVASVSALNYSNKEAEIQLQLQKGLLTAGEAEDKILALKKEQAAANLVLLEQEAALTTNPKVQAELQKQILAAKLVIGTETRNQVELERTVKDSMAEAMQSVLNGSKSLLEAGKGFLQSIINSVNKMITEELSGSIMKWLKGAMGGASGGDTGSGVIGSFLGMLGLNGASGSSAASAGGAAGAAGGGASGGILQTAVSWIGSLFGGGYADGGGVSGAIRGPGTNTSDSIVAKLSHGEYVLDAEDVKKMGGFQVLDNMREKLHAYKNGGGVMAAAQAAASSGSAAASRALGGSGPVIHMTINTPDANSFRSSQAQIMSQMGAMSRMALARGS